MAALPLHAAWDGTAKPSIGWIGLIYREIEALGPETLAAVTGESVLFFFFTLIEGAM